MKKELVIKKKKKNASLVIIADAAELRSPLQEIKYVRIDYASSPLAVPLLSADDSIFIETVDFAL